MWWSAQINTVVEVDVVVSTDQYSGEVDVVVSTDQYSGGSRCGGQHRSIQW